MWPMPEPVLWTVSSHCAVRERRPPGSDYWWDNAERSPDTPTALLQYTVAGEMIVREPGREHRVPAGCAALMCCPGDSAYGLPPDAREVYETQWVNLRGAGLMAHWSEIVRLRGPVVPMEPGGPDHRLFRSVLELAAARAATPPERLAAAIQALVLSLYAGARAARADGLRPVDRAVEAMLAAPTAAWSVKRLAEQHGISREHFARAFRDRVGVPPAAWLARERVARAVALLEQTDLPVRAVRDQSGFASSHALIRRVRSATGLGPLELRRRARRG